MQVTYLAHSGFLVELEGVFLLFDYYYGEIPPLPEGSPLYVFVSHRHPDHFNPDIFRMFPRSTVTYILAYDIKLNAYGMRKYGITQKDMKHIVSMRMGEDRLLADDLRVRTYHSTDEGVAFLVSLQGKHIYHGGDHNWWHWSELGKSYTNNMAANYKKEIRQLIQDEPRLDLAFVPLDPRLGESYYYGMKYFCEEVACDVIFPMHFSGDYSCRDRFVAEFGYGDRVRNIEREGQQFQEK